MTVIKSLLCRFNLSAGSISKRFYSSHDIRNIGILAHIDAGKTTTTERMLFYTGKTRSLGEVHRGNTVTDYLAQERERGITICSSAVTFPWRNHKINLLDTPGHIDFTMEVEQSLYAVDGVVVVLDGTAGVEAQTVTVWAQSERHHLPKIIFVNKMDRPDADFDKCLEDLKDKLEAKPLCLQFPQKDDKGILSVLDIIALKRLNWNVESLGLKYTELPITDETLMQNVKDKRNELIDKLSGLDDELADFVISTESFDSVSNQLIYAAIRRATAQQKVVPVLLGSAYKNVGIQPLMDSVISYLPAPFERNQIYQCFENDFVGKVFKIVHDKQRGALTLVRIFRGCLRKGMRIIDTKGNPEVVNKLYEPLADEYREIHEANEGDVVICAGLKHTATGDLLTANMNSLKHAQNRLEKLRAKDNSAFIMAVGLRNGAEDTADDEPKNVLNDEIFTIDPKIPDAVYFCSIEPPSLSAQNAMEIALKQLQREDPSLRVTYDETTGQTVLGGMGELHLEIIKSRILTEYKIDVDLGPLQIAYKEAIEGPAKDTFSIEKEIAGSKQIVSITMELLHNQTESFSLDKSAENAPNLNALRPKTLNIIKKGALSALERGPRVAGQVIETQVRLHNVTIGRGTADSFLMSAAAQCIQKILSTTGTRILEPMMSLQIVIPSERVSAVLADLSRRRAIINDVLPKGMKNKVILVKAPLAELTGYSSVLRTISSGTASMTMQPCGFTNMNAVDETLAIRRVQGLD